jgi:oligosaccharide reducing-end xylanase
MQQNNRNLFTETGKSGEAIHAKIQAAYTSLFEGDPDTERIYFQVNASEAYITDIGHGDIRSEGMSYGMMIAALLGKQNIFDSLWNFAKKYMQHQKGPSEAYFSWQVNPKDFSMMDPGAAPDGEEYFAASLIFAADQFGIPHYRKEAERILKAMAHKIPQENIEVMMDAKTELVRFSPVSGNDFTDPSYHTPAFYRLYASLCDKVFWENAAAKSILFLKSTIHPKTGLAPDYAEFNGLPKSTPWCPESDCFSGDAWRVALNLGLDYAHFQGDPWEFQTCEKRLQFFDARRPYKADYQIDGSDYPTSAREATPGLIAMNACAALALPEGHPLIAPFVEDLWQVSIPKGKWRYYDGMLYIIALLACAGFFFHKNDSFRKIYL